jgi:hypothetical protein
MPDVLCFRSQLVRDQGRGGFLADAPRRDHVFAGLPLLDGDDAPAVHSRPPLQNDCRGLTYRETTKAAIYRFPEQNRGLLSRGDRI